MSEKIVLGTLAAVAGIGVGIHEIDKHVPPNPNEVAKAELQDFQAGIAAGEKQPVLEGGAAHVELTNTSRYADIINPVVTKHGHVIGRDKNTGKVIVYYKDDPLYESTGTETSARQITFTEHGKDITEQQAVEAAKKLVISPVSEVGGQIAFKAAPGQGFNNQPVAVDSLKKVITEKKFVPDNNS